MSQGGKCSKKGARSGWCLVLLAQGSEVSELLAIFLMLAEQVQIQCLLNMHSPLLLNCEVVYCAVKHISEMAFPF